jgi:hypothetical protein
MSGSGAFNALAANNLNVTGILQAAQIRTTQPMDVSAVSVGSVAVDPNNVKFKKDIALTVAEIASPSVLARPLGSITELSSEFTDVANYSNLSTEYYRALDGFGGPNNFAYCKQKPLLTIGENFGSFLPTGGLDGMGAYLLDDSTVRVIYNCEGYTFGNRPTVLTGNVKLAGTRVHAIDFDRTKMAAFMENSTAASDMIKNAFNPLTGKTFYNVKGQALGPRNPSGPSSAPHFPNTDKDGNSTLPDPIKVFQGVTSTYNSGPLAGLMNGSDWLVMTGCSADLCMKNQWDATSNGLADSMFIWVDEYIEYIDEAKGNVFTGCGIYATDLATRDTFTIGSLGGGGWEKITEFNTGDPRYVGFAVASYLDLVSAPGLVAARNGAGGRADYNEPAYSSPQQIYIGLKNYKENGVALTAQEIADKAPSTYLARNGLAYGRCYGFAVTAEEATARNLTNPGGYYYQEFERYFSNVARRNGDVIDGSFLPTTWQWNGNVTPVWQTNLFEWQDAPLSAFPGDAAGSSSSVSSTTHKFLNAKPAGGSGGDNKAEHSSADPRGGQRFVISFNTRGAPSSFVLMYDMPDLKATLNAAPNGTLPNGFTGSAKCAVQYGSSANYGIYTGGGAKNKLGFYSTNFADRRNSNSLNADEQKKVPFIVDTLQWYAAAGGENWMYFGEDSSTCDAEACWLAKFDPDSLVGSNVETYFMSQLSGASKSSKALQTIPPRCNYNVSTTGTYGTRDNSTEYSGAWDLTGLLVKNQDGTFKATPSSRIRQFDDDVSINDKLLMLGTQHHMSSGGPINTKGLGQGGQLIMLKPKGLPTA